jgi:hypothetical protein
MAEFDERLRRLEETLARIIERQDELEAARRRDQEANLRIDKILAARITGTHEGLIKVIKLAKRMEVHVFPGIATDLASASLIVGDGEDIDVLNPLDFRDGAPTEG